MTTATPGVKFKTYDNYKDSGIPWVGKIPVNWELFPNKAFLTKRKIVVGPRFKSLTLLSLTKKGAIVRDVESGKGKFAADMSSYQEVRTGDLIFCLFDIEETPRTVALAHDYGMITGAYTVFECKDELIAKYLELFYIAMDDEKRLSYLYTGLRNTIPPPKFLSIHTTIPSKKEMQCIVDIVNIKIKLVDEVIKKKKKLITYLKEKRQALITQAVTKGLDTNVKMKDSGVEWLHIVPESWKVEKFKFHSGQVISSVNEPEEFRVSLENIESWTGKYIETDSEYSGLGTAFAENDILFGKLRPYLAKVFLADKAGEAGGDILVYRAKDDLIPRYLAYLMSSYSFVDNISNATYGARMPRTDAKFIGNTLIPIPSLQEQELILDFIDMKSEKMDLIVKSTELQILKLEEYKSALIYNAVTGKIKV